MKPLKHGDTCPCCGQTVKMFTCQHCGKQGTYNGTRPRQFCSNRCNVADFRARQRAKGGAANGTV
jgi:predicted amidophosphoribosyltransferase